MRPIFHISAMLMPRLRERAVFLAMMVFAASLATACHTSPDGQGGNVVVSAPADGVVRRVLVGDGATVEKDTAIVELAVPSEQPSASQASSAKARQSTALRNAETVLASAEGEANRTAEELRRIEPLVRRGLASQAELDKARSVSRDAQERLQLAREKVRTAEEDRNQPAGSPANEEIIAVRVPSAGTVQSVSVQAGQVVKSGQPIATLVSRT